MEEPTQIIKKLSNPLQNELYFFLIFLKKYNYFSRHFDFFSKYLKKFQIFTGNHFSEQTLHDIVNIMEEKYYEPNEIIVNKNSKESGIYLIIDGKVEIF